MKLHLLLPALLLAANAAATAATVTVQVNDNVFVYDNPVRLSRVLLPVGNQAPWYWPASRLVDLNDASALRQKQQLIYDIDKLARAMDRSDSTFQSLQAVRQQLRDWNVQTRIVQPISFYPSRLSIEKNPLLSEGRYLIRLTERPRHVTVMGAVSEPLRLPHAGNETLNKLNTHIRRLAGADNSYVYVIYPDGRIFKRGSAYWNESHAPLMPGSTVYVPVAEPAIKVPLLSSEDLQTLNENIATLAISRGDQDD